MLDNDLREILRDNILELLNEGLPPGTRRAGTGALIRLGVSNGTAQRILEGKTNLGLDVLEDLGRIFGIAPWRLLRRFNAAVPSTSYRSEDEIALALGRRISALPRKQALAIESLVEALSAGIHQEQKAQ